MIRRRQRQLGGDEKEQNDDRFFEMDEIALQRFQYKIHRPQTENGEHHRAINDERLARDGNDSRDAVESEHHIRKLNNGKTEQKRGGDPSACFHRLRMTKFGMLGIFAGKF